MMQEASCLFRGMHHLKLANVKRINTGQINTSTRFYPGKRGFLFVLCHALAGEQLAQQSVGITAVHFRQRVNQEFGLGSIVRRIEIDSQKSKQPINQVVDGWAQVGGTHTLAAPAVQAEPVTLVFFQGRRIEDADHVIFDAYGFYAITALSGSSPVECVHILKNGQHTLVRQSLMDKLWQMVWS